MFRLYHCLFYVHLNRSWTLWPAEKLITQFLVDTSQISQTQDKQIYSQSKHITGAVFLDFLSSVASVARANRERAVPLRSFVPTVDMQAAKLDMTITRYIPSAYSSIMNGITSYVMHFVITHAWNNIILINNANLLLDRKCLMWRTWWRIEITWFIMHLDTMWPIHTGCEIN